MDTKTEIQSEPNTQHWQQTLWFTLVGLLIGILIKTISLGFLNNASADWIGLRATLPFTLILCLPVLLLLWKKSRSLILLVYLISLLAAAWWVGSQAQLTQDWEGHTVPSYNFMSVAFYFLIGLVVMISLPFVQAWQKQRPHFTYTHLFAYAWNNVHILILAAVFALVVFLVTLIAASLFEMVMTSQNEQLGTTTAGGLIDYLQANFELITLSAFGAGVSIIQRHSQVLLRLHTLAFALYRILAYMLAIIILGFTILMLPQWQQFLAEENAALIFLGLVLASILFLNTLIERGSKTLPIWAQYLFGAQIIILPILTALALYAIFLRVQQYGLSPSRFLSLLMSLMLLIYTLSYALQFIRLRSHWSEGLKTVNPPLAILTAVLASLVLTPVLDPQAWSVRNQLARLQSGAVTAEHFDYYSLLTKLGKPGIDAATELRTWQTNPEYTAILKGLESAQDTNNSTPKTSEALAKLKIIPATTKIDLQAFATQAQRLPNFAYFGLGAEACYQTISSNTECLLVFQDLNADSKDEALLLAFNTLPAENNLPLRYQIEGKIYKLDKTGLPMRGKELSNASVKTNLIDNEVSREQVYPELDQASFAQIKAAAEARQFTPIMPALPDLQIGNQRLQEN